jgi:hypothetical protein
MFVKWKRRRLYQTRANYLWRHDPGWVRAAYLVESVRTAAGPRHRHVCYLGSIREISAHYWCHRAPFWAAATRRLDAAGIEGPARSRCEAALQAVVPRVTEEEWAAKLAHVLDAQARGDWYGSCARLLAERFPDAGVIVHPLRRRVR